MQIFEHHLTVTTNDLDELNHVNNVRYVEWVNTVAKLHWEQNASAAILKEHFWILLSHSIEYKSPALLNDSIVLKTYVITAKGVTSTRVVEIYNADTNTLLAKSETNWCLMSTQTKRPTRITPEIEILFC